MTPCRARTAPIFTASSWIFSRYSSAAGKRQPRKTCPLGPPRTWSWVEIGMTSPCGSTRSWTLGEVLSRASRNSSTIPPIRSNFAK